PQRAADGGGIAAHLAMPERVADHDPGRRAPALVVRWREEAARGGLDAERIEEGAAHPQRVGVAGLAPAGEVETVRAPRGQRGEALRAGADLLPQRVGELRIAAGEAARR